MATAQADLPSAAHFYVPSLPTLPGKLNQHPTHPLDVWAGLLPSADPQAKEDDKTKDDKILCVYISSCSWCARSEQLREIGAREVGDGSATLRARWTGHGGREARSRCTGVKPPSNPLTRRRV